jgi:hypothetical protein
VTPTEGFAPWYLRFISAFFGHTFAKKTCLVKRYHSTLKLVKFVSVAFSCTHMRAYGKVIPIRTNHKLEFSPFKIFQISAIFAGVPRLTLDGDSGAVRLHPVYAGP